jgi:hypothetical protein
MRFARRALAALWLASMLFAPAGAALAAESSSNAQPSARAELAAELAALAPRIEALKRDAAQGRAASGELERLLARAQELAALLDAGGAGTRAAGVRAAEPDAQELRERADALRDRADRLATALVRLDGQLAAARRRAELAERLDEATEAGELFSDAAPRRSRATAPAGGTLTPGPQGPPGSPSQGAPAFTPGGSVAAPDHQRLSGGAAGDESTAALGRRRAELVRELGALRAQAAALDAEARAAETRR